MPRWEYSQYIVTRIIPDNDRKLVEKASYQGPDGKTQENVDTDVVKVLNSFGGHGWEVVSVQTDNAALQNTTSMGNYLSAVWVRKTYLLKRAQG